MLEKTAGTFLALCMTLALFTGCTAAKGAEKKELVVFAAASLTETLTELGGQYMAENEDVSIVFNFDSSGALKTQIEEGAVCDVFISAGQAQMDALAGVYAADTRFDILENEVVLVASPDAPAVLTFDALAEKLRGGEVLLAAGGADVPVGQYTQKIFDYYGLDAAALDALGCVTYGSNVKEITTQVREAAVDYGVVYATDAFSAGLTVSDTAAAEMCGQVIYPAAAMAASGHGDAARAFFDFLRSDTADKVFEAAGFTPIG